MQIIETRDEAALEAALRRDPYLHLYELGDLDDFFWPRTTWFVTARAGGGFEHVALLYDADGHTVLIALTRDVPVALPFVRELAPRLPATCYAHLTPGLAAALPPHARIESCEPHLKMALTRPALDVPGADAAEPLGPADRAELEAFYATAYPGNWFDPRMLETGQYVGLRVGGALACVAGIHVYSETRRVASLGNIATHPAHRGRGLAARATARLCAALLERVDHVGLNVHAANAVAIACYRRLGFTEVAPFDEIRVRT